MKKLLSIALALALVLSLGVSAFATISGKDADDKDITQSPVNGNAKWVKADASGDELSVTGDVTNSINSQRAVSAEKGATINVGGDVTKSGSFYAVSADGQATNVTVGGDIKKTGSSDAIHAVDGATVSVGGNVEKSGGNSCIYADGSNTKVVVTGNVSAIELGDSDASVFTGGNATVKVGGDVKGAGKGYTIKANDNSMVIVEGLVTGNMLQSGDAEIYLGQLDGDIANGSDLVKIHYLIGVAPEGSAPLSDVNVDGEYVRFGTIEGVDYYYTATADPDRLSGEKIKLTPVEGKILTGVSGFNSDDIICNIAADGSYAELEVFTDKFKGGLQNLVLVLVNKPGPSSEPVYYLVPVGSVTTASVKLPAGVAEGLIKALDSADHAGITVDSSLVGDGSVKVLKDGKELSAKDFSIYTHADGSIDVILSNTFLYALGSGSYDFTAVVGGTEIEFSVVVAV